MKTARRRWVVRGGELQKQKAWRWVVRDWNPVNRFGTQRARRGGQLQTDPRTSSVSKAAGHSISVRGQLLNLRADVGGSVTEEEVEATWPREAPPCKYGDGCSRMSFDHFSQSARLVESAWDLFRICWGHVGDMSGTCRGLPSRFGHRTKKLQIKFKDWDPKSRCLERFLRRAP